jgi:hypothetical protein
LRVNVGKRDDHLQKTCSIGVTIDVPLRFFQVHTILKNRREQIKGAGLHLMAVLPSSRPSFKPNVSLCLGLHLLQSDVSVVIDKVARDYGRSWAPGS